MTVYDIKTGQPVDLDGKAAADGVLAGQYGVPRGQRVPVARGDGTIGTIPSENLPRALGGGFRFPSDDELEQYKAEKEYGGFGGGLEAFTAGAIRAMTGGLSDVVLSPNPEAKHALRGLEKAHPIVSGAGELGGAIAGLFGPDELSAPGLIAKAGEAAAKPVAEIAGKQLLGRLATRGVQGATEGGLWGLSQFISDSALSDHPDLDGEKLFAAMGGGALTGGILGGSGELFASGLRKGGDLLMSRLGGKGLNEALSDFAERRALSTVGIGSNVKQFGLGNKEERRVISRYLLDKLPLSAGDNAESILQKATDASNWHGANIGAITQDIDARGATFDTPRFTARATQELLDPIADDPAKAGVYNALKGLIEGYQSYGPGGDAGPMSFSKAWELQSSLRKKLGLGDSLFAAREELPKLRQMFRDEIIDQADKVSPHFGEMLRSESRNYRSAEVIEKMSNKALQRQEMNNPYSLFDRMAGLGAGALAGGPLGVVAAGGGMFANKLMRERGRSIVSVLADRLSQSGVLSRLSSGLSRFVQSGLSASPAFGGASRALLERAVARSAEDLLATHVQLAKNDPEYLASVGMQNETPEIANLAATNADSLGQVQSIVNAHDQRVDAAISRFLGKQGGASPSIPEPKITPEKFASQFAQLQQIVSDPQTLQQTVNPERFSSISPQIAMMMSATATKAIQYLYSIAPKQPNKSPVPALNNEWTPTAPQLARWNRSIQAIQNPESVVQNLKSGNVSKEEIEALRVVYPKLAQNIQNRLNSALSTHEKPLSYAQKLALAKFSGSPVGSAGDPQRFALLQSAHAVTVTQGAPGGPPPRERKMSAADGRQEVDTLKNYQTQTQRSEARAGLA